MSVIYTAPRVEVIGQLHALTLKPGDKGTIPKLPNKMYANNSDNYTYKGHTLHS